MNRRQFLTGLLATSAIVAVPPPIAEAVTSTVDPKAVLDGLAAYFPPIESEVQRIYWMSNEGLFQIGVEKVTDLYDHVRIIDERTPIDPAWFGPPEPVVFPVNKTDDPFMWRL